jgi:hypothetical protein
MRKINVFFLMVFAFGAMLSITSCGDDATCEDFCTNGTCIDGECVPDEVDDNVVIVDANITSDETWTSDNIYILAARIAVTSGATLTIEPGTIIKGQAGSGPNATALLIARGAQLIADGTASQPIIFTSVADEIMPGQIASPNLDTDVNSLWGGLIVLGNAPISADAEAVQIEGIPPSDANGLYGGNDPSDNSGILRYVSVRHGGSDIGEGNEINGISFGGVGSGTIVENIEVAATFDDGIECYGGNVNITNALVWGQGDDAYDMDQAYSGTIDNFIYIAGANSDHAMELDGPEGSASGSFTLRNGSLKGGNGEYIDFRDGVTCTVENCYFFNFSSSSDVEFDNNGVSQNYLDGSLIVSGLQFNTSHLSDGNLTIEDIFQEKVAEDDDGNPIENPLDIFNVNPLNTNIITTSSPSVGANVSAFQGWTMADANGQLADF